MSIEQSVHLLGLTVVGLIGVEYRSRLQSASKLLQGAVTSHIYGLAVELDSLTLGIY